MECREIDDKRGKLLTISNMLEFEKLADMISEWFAQIIPAKWFIEAIRKIMIEGVPVRYVTVEILIMTAMAVAVFTAAVIKFKDKLD